MQPWGSKRWIELGFLGLVVFTSVAVRLPFRETALIRDEGEYALMGQEILRGAVPYADCYNQKTPFVFYFLAFVQRIAGPGVAAIRVATLIYGAIATVLLYLTARRLFGPPAALWAVLAFSVMTFDQCGVIHSASTEFFMLLWIVLAVYLWHPGQQRQSRWCLLLAGVAAGLAYQTKQIGVFVLVFLLAERLWRWMLAPRDKRSGWRAVPGDTGAILAGFMMVLGLTLLFFACSGALRDYVECTWTNNWQYVGHRWFGPARALDLTGKVLVGVTRWDIGLWVLGLAGLVAMGVRRHPPAGHGLWLLLLTLGTGALLAGQAYQHYYEPLIVPLALGCGVVGAWLTSMSSRRGLPTWLRVAALLALAGPWLWPLAHNLSYLEMSSAQFDALLKLKSFPDAAVSPQVAEYVESRTAPDEPILVVGSEPQIYFYAHRRPATRMVLMYPLTGPYTFAGRLTDELVNDLVTRKPKYVVLVAEASSLTEFPATLDPFVRRIVASLRKDYVLETQLPHPGPGSPDINPFVHIYRRKTDG